MKMSKLTAITFATLAALALTTAAAAQKTTCKWVQDPEQHWGKTMMQCETPRRDIYTAPDAYTLGQVVQPIADPFAMPPSSYDPRAALNAQLAQMLRAQTDLHIACIRARGTFKNGVCTWESRSTQK